MKVRSSEDLITRYLDDSATEEEMAELNHLLVTSAEVRSQFQAATEQAMALVQGLNVAEKKKVIQFPKIVWLAACLCLLLALFFVLRPDPMARLVSSGGQIEMPSREKISSGDTLRTIGDDSFLDFEFRDGTKVRLSGNTTITVTGDEQKRLVVHQGGVSLNVIPQPKSAPLTMMTPTAELTVRGTSFGVFASEGATQLEVAEGAVELKRLADGHSVRVEAGEYSVASDLRHTFGVKSIPRLSKTWSLDLRKDPESALEVGAAAMDPDGSIVGARGKPGYDAAELIATHNAWSKGDYALFRVEQDSVMKIRLKMDHPSWLNFILNYRSSEPGSANVVTCLYQDDSLVKTLKPGEWRTVELRLAKPLKIAKHPTPFGDIPVGWSCFSVGISAGDEKRGLVIERIWTE